MFSAYDASTMMLLVITLYVYSPVLSRKQKALMFLVYGLFLVSQSVINVIQRM